MNIKSSPPSDFSSLDNFTNSTLALLPPTTSNQTAALLTALNNTGGYTWEMKYYWIIALSLLCTIPLSILAGGVFRLSIRFAAQYVVYWRLIVILVGLLSFVCLYVIVPLFGSDIGRGFSLVLYVFTLGFYSVWKAYESYRIKQRQLLWVLFVFLVFGCFGINFFGIFGSATVLSILIPLIYLLLMWAGPEIRGWWIDRV